MISSMVGRTIGRAWTALHLSDTFVKVHHTYTHDNDVSLKHVIYAHLRAPQKVHGNMSASKHAQASVLYDIEDLVAV